ncbi:MAG: hypothetical protein ABIC68_04090 [Candidatus Omnitrophota bacterium]
MMSQAGKENQVFGQPDLPHGKLISIRLFGLVYAFVGVLITCFKFMLSSFLFPVFITFLIIFEGAAVVLAGIGVIFLKKIYRILLLMTSYVAVSVFFYIMVFERGIVLYFANGARLRLIPYPISILAFVFFMFAIFYFSSRETKEIFH